MNNNKANYSQNLQANISIYQDRYHQTNHHRFFFQVGTYWQFVCPYHLKGHLFWKTETHKHHNIARKEMNSTKKFEINTNV